MLSSLFRERHWSSLQTTLSMVFKFCVLRAADRTVKSDFDIRSNSFTASVCMPQWALFKVRKSYLPTGACAEDFAVEAGFDAGFFAAA